MNNGTPQEAQTALQEGNAAPTVPTPEQLEIIANQVEKIGDAMWFLAEHADEVKREEDFGKHLVGLVGEVARATVQRCLIIQAALKGKDPSEYPF